jgi:hypothetical protein
MKIIEMIAGSRGMGDAKSMAEMLRRMGRRGDTMLAHITPEEADMLMEAGGAGTMNPDTGLPEFYTRNFDYDDDIGRAVQQQRSRQSQSPQEFDFSAASTPVAETDYRVFREPSQSTRSSNQRAVETQREFPIYENFQQDPAIPQRRPSVYQRLTGREQPEDLMQMSPVPRVYDAATGNRFTSEDPYSQALFNRSADTYFNNQTFDAPYGSRPLAELSPLEDFTLNRFDVDAGRRGGGGGFADQAEAGIQEFRDLLDRYPNLTRSGTAAASILAQALMFNRANQAMKRDIEETRRAAEPFRQGQSEAMSRATGGGLTAEQEQELETAQSRARQGLGDRGMQTGSAASGILASQQRRARSLARQESFQEALRLANIADQYDRRALEMELQRDQQLAQLFAGILGREVQQAQRTEAPVPTNQVQPAR